MQKQCPLGNVVPQEHETPEYHGFYTDFFEKYQEQNLPKLFGQLIKNNMPYTDERYIRWTKRVNNKFQTEEMSLAFSRLTKLINKLYTPDGNLIYDLPYNSYNFYDSKINQVTYLKLLNLLQNDKKLQHYFVYDDFNKYINGKTGDYLKKANAIERIKNLPDTEFSSPEEHERILKIMYAYLCVKVIRNRLNHASEEDLSDDEQKVIRLLKKFTYKNEPLIDKLELDVYYKHIKPVIEFGLSL